MNDIFTLIMENFELILTLLVIVCLIFYIIDWMSYRKTRKYLCHTFKQGIETDIDRNEYRERLFQASFKASKKHMPYINSVLSKLKNKEHIEKKDLYWIKRPVYKKEKFIEFFSGLFWVLFIVWLIRSFFWEPFQIPSSSMEPTLQNGDFILVDKNVYGFKLPVLGTTIIPMQDVKNGDVIVFKWPGNTKQNFIKRVIGVPGDVVAFKNGNVMVNGKQAMLTNLNQTHIGPDDPRPFNVYSENLAGRKHLIQFINSNGLGISVNNNSQLVQQYHAIRSPEIEESLSFKVPEGQYFVMGDNRDLSDDGRYWGFVPEKDLVGKALFIWMNSDCITLHGQCNRIGDKIN